MFSCIITAGGSGQRFDKTKKKQFFELNGKPLIFITIDAFYNIDSIKEIIVTLPEADYEEMSALLTKAYPQKVKAIIGGITRQTSVLNALNTCDENNKYVMIHDAVRPFVKQSDLVDMMSIVQSCNAVIPASKVKNTIKTTNGDTITQTLDRDNLIEVYTPQMFSLKMIKDYHHKAKSIDHHFTDDASILEYFDEPVRWFETDSLNIKITTKEDLVLAKYLLTHCSK